MEEPQPAQATLVVWLPRGQHEFNPPCLSLLPPRRPRLKAVARSPRLQGGNTIVLRESSGPRTYRFGKTVTYVTKSGKVLDEDTVRTRIKVGVPVHVHYLGEGDNMLVDRVILDED